MGELKKLDQLTEFQLTNAIQKAASMSLGSDRDRSQILAEQLDQADIPKHLTKLAAQSFNRRLTVITLGKRDQDTKADSFPLADVQKTTRLRGCEEQMQKKASVSCGEFKFTYTPPAKGQMLKAASLEQEPKLTVGQVLKKLSAVLDRAVADIQIQSRDLMHQQAVLQQMHKKAAAELSDDIKSSKLLSAVYGQKYTSLFSQLGQQALQKFAAFAVLPDTKGVRLAKAVMQQHDKVQQLQKDFIDKRASVTTLAKEASEFQTAVHQGRLKGIIKEADGFQVAKNLAANSVVIPAVIGAKLGEGAVKGSADFLQGAGKYLARDYAKHPSSAITGSLMNTDRADDKAARLIDMLADRDFKDYPAQDIQSAVQKVLIEQPAYLSPRFKQHLKTAVTQRLLQGGKTNAADQAASATTMKSLLSADQTRAEAGAAKALAQLSAKSIKGQSPFGAVLSAAQAVRDNLPAIPNDAVIKGSDKIMQEYARSFEQKAIDKATKEQAEAKRRLQLVRNYIHTRNADIEKANKVKEEQVKLLSRLALGGINHPRARNKTYAGLPQVTNLSDLSLTERQKALQIARQQRARMTPEQWEAVKATLSK